MNSKEMRELIDAENGAGFNKNIKLDSYNFFKNKSFIAFKVCKVEDIGVVNIRYIYSDNKKDLKSLIAYCCNFWMGLGVKFIYYREKEKDPYVVSYLKELGFKTNYIEDFKWEHEFECVKGESPCKCRVIESYV